MSPCRFQQIRRKILVLVGMLFLTVSALAEDSHDPTPPQLTGDHFAALKKQSPFDRPIDLANALVLTGVGQYDGKPMAVLLDTRTSKSHVVTDKPNEKGWKMERVSDGQSVEEMIASISTLHGEVIEIEYNQELIDHYSKSGQNKRAEGIRIPQGKDSRKPPTDEERSKFPEYVKKRFSTMNEEQRKKVGKLMGEKMRESGGKLSDRQKGEVFMQIMNSVAPEKK
ncbi:MAG: hypothetical protein AAF226_17120 [Verrucomicrobiota bacterium]